MIKKAKLVCPNSRGDEKKWLFKTEYFEAFPSFELEMLSRGYYVANIENTTRWCLEEDTERQAEFGIFLKKEFNLNKKCIVVGMSCGGMQGVYLAAKHPELVASLYLDAPVLNLLSCPCGIGKAGNDMYDEFVNATEKQFRSLSIIANIPLIMQINLYKIIFRFFLFAAIAILLCPMMKTENVYLIIIWLIMEK